MKKKHKNPGGLTDVERRAAEGVVSTLLTVEPEMRERILAAALLLVRQADTPESVARKAQAARQVLDLLLKGEK